MGLKEDPGGSTSTAGISDGFAVFKKFNRHISTKSYEILATTVECIQAIIYQTECCFEAYMTPR